MVVVAAPAPRQTHLQCDGAQLDQTADLRRQAGQLVAVQVELNEMGAVAQGRRQLGDGRLAQVEYGVAVVADALQLLGDVQDGFGLVLLGGRLELEFGRTLNGSDGDGGGGGDMVRIVVVAMVWRSGGRR